MRSHPLLFHAYSSFIFYNLIYLLFTPYDPLFFIYLILHINQGLFRGIAFFKHLTNWPHLANWQIYRVCVRFSDIVADLPIQRWFTTLPVFVENFPILIPGFPIPEFSDFDPLITNIEIFDFYPGIIDFNPYKSIIS